MPKIISVHAPKAAGSMLLIQLQKIFGSAVYIDYQDDPANPCSPRNIDPSFYSRQPLPDLSSYSVVHGHFHPEKYNGVDGAFRMTFLRHPVENVVSIYRFWLLSPPNMWGSPLFKYFKEKNLDLESFASLPLIRNLYSESYFGGYDMNRFDFVGDYAFLQRDLACFGELVGLDIGCDDRINDTSEIAMDRGMPVYLPTMDELEKLGGLLERDIDFYYSCVGRR